MNIKTKIQTISYHIENNFFLTVIRRSLTMMIPLILVGGIACALTNLPYIDYTAPHLWGLLPHIHTLLNNIYQGTFGLFSLALVILLSLSYSMEKNESMDIIAMYVVVALGAYGSQLNIGTSYFNIDDIGIKGSFSAMFITLLACYCFEHLRQVEFLRMKKAATGMESICANAIHSIFPMICIIGITLFISRMLFFCFDVHSIHELFSKASCSLFENLNNNFLAGLLYTFLLHLLWFCGFHGSHLLEPVAQSTFLNVSPGVVFSKSFFDTYVVMGGCGTTICVLIILLLFYRHKRIGNLGKIGFFTVIFNLNEILNFGIPIVLNPILGIPFILTPMACYCISYFATATGLVPEFIQQIPWSTPILFSGYMATGSFRGVLLQIVCILTGICIYLPFIRLHDEIQTINAREKLKVLIKELQQCEQDNSTPVFLTRTDSLGAIARMLLDDLKTTIQEDKSYLLYQPQMDNDGHCIGAEALLRWQHPLYGFIYPPLILFLAKEGGILADLESKIIDKAAYAIHKTRTEYDGPFKISINITAKSLLWDIESCISHNLDKYNIPASNLWIEITEQDVITNSDYVIQKLKRLKNKGHTLLIDDFGMGHTSLIYLQSTYFGVVKLDGSLVKNLLDNTTNQKIVGSIVDLSKELNIKVIAEYVETTELRDKLEELGCNWYQGYLYSKPVPLDEFITYIKETNA